MTNMETHHTDADCTHHIAAIVTITIRTCGACDLLVFATDGNTDAILLQALGRIRENITPHPKVN